MDAAIRLDARLPLILVVAVSLGALATALASQLWGGLEPCVLCVYQRYVYVAAVAVGLAGLTLSRRGTLGRAAMLLAGLVFLTGFGIAAFHVGVEQHWWRGTAGCHAPALDPGASIEDLRERLLNQRFAPCDEIPWSLFGISMAGYNAIASLGFALASLWVARRIALEPDRITPTRCDT